MTAEDREMQMEVCACGTAFPADYSKFCRVCGKKRPEPAMTAEPEKDESTTHKDVCVCGAPYPTEFSKFCDKCGAKRPDEAKRPHEAQAKKETVAKDELEVLQVRVFSPLGFETVLDPVFAELLFVAKWRSLPLRLSPCRYPHTAALGPLPAGVGGALGALPRSELLTAVAKLGDSGYSEAGLSADDRAFASLLRNKIGKAIVALLYGEDGIWQDYTRPTLTRAHPFAYGWYVSWEERRRQRAGICETDYGELEDLLQALAKRLGDADTFARDDLGYLDACAYGHLAVLYSIPCERGSTLHKILGRFPVIANYLDRLEIRLGAWPDPRSFLASLQPDERTAAAAALLAGNSADCSSSSAVGGRSPWQTSSRNIADTEGGDGAADTDRLEWWQVWGWSWGGKIRRPDVQKRVQSPPDWYFPAFATVACVSIASAVSAGWNPFPLGRLAALLNSVQGSFLHARRTVNE